MKTLILVGLSVFVGIINVIGLYIKDRHNY